jgi:hypothetical protein
MSKSDPYANQVKNWRSHGVKNSFSGADYYVISRGNGRREIFRLDRDRFLYFDLLKR